jgi:predicted GH43/DUF377 family glycosyl hydrolase
MKVFRCPDNPIISPRDIKPSGEDFEVIGVFNAGAGRLADEIILLFRVAERPANTSPDVVTTAVYDVAAADIVRKDFSKDDPENDFSDPRLIVRTNETYLTSISHLRVARSHDGVSFEIEDMPALAAANGYESFGIEDPRITLIEGTSYITYVAASPFGVTTCLASTKDFKSFARHGVIFCPENKDAVLFPEKIDGKYHALHRPFSPLFKRNDIWLAESKDLLCWGGHRRIIGPRPGMWDEKKIGAGAPPFKTEHGWLEIYHGVDRDDRYCLGAVLLDLNRPDRIIARSDEPILAPEALYECSGFFGKVIFSCGALLENEKVKIYYGAADTCICYAEVSLSDIIEALNL